MALYKTKVRDRFGKLLELVQETPSKGSKFPTVIFVSGFGADCHEFGFYDQISDALVKNGFQTIRFSFEGTGRSEGDFVETTLDKQIGQLDDIIEYTLKDRFTDQNKLGLFGHGFGSTVFIAALPKPRIKTLIFTGVFGNPYDGLVKLFKRQRGFDPDNISVRERSDNKKISIGPSFWKGVQEFELSRIASLTQSVLFIHGEKDKKAKLFQALDLFKFVTSRKKFLLIEKSDHAFTGRYRQEVIKQAVEWFLINMRM